jgi:hypothetical protein
MFVPYPAASRARRLTLKASGLLFDHAALLPDRASAVTLVHAVPATPPSYSRKCSSSRGTWPAPWRAISYQFIRYLRQA